MVYLLINHNKKDVEEGISRLYAKQYQIFTSLEKVWTAALKNGWDDGGWGFIKPYSPITPGHMIFTKGGDTDMAILATEADLPQE